MTAFWAADVEAGELLTQPEATDLAAELELEFVGILEAGVFVGVGPADEVVTFRPELVLDGERLLRVLEL